jgi:hypothetical protein
MSRGIDGSYDPKQIQGSRRCVPIRYILSLQTGV